MSSAILIWILFKYSFKKNEIGTDTSARKRVILRESEKYNFLVHDATAEMT